MLRTIWHLALIFGFGFGTLTACSGGGGGAVPGGPAGSGASGEGEVTQVSFTESSQIEAKTVDQRIAEYSTLARTDFTAEFKAELQGNFTAQAYSADTFSAELATAVLQGDVNLQAVAAFVPFMAKAAVTSAPFYAWKGVTMADGNAFTWESALASLSTNNPRLATFIESRLDLNAIERNLDAFFKSVSGNSLAYTTYVTAVMKVFWNNVEAVQPSEIDLAKFAPGIDFSRIENKDIEYTFRRLAASTSFRVNGVMYTWFTWQPSAIEGPRELTEARAGLRDNLDQEAQEKEVGIHRVDSSDTAAARDNFAVKVVAASENPLLPADFVLNESLIVRFLAFLVNGSNGRFFNFGAYFGIDSRNIEAMRHPAMDEAGDGQLEQNVTEERNEELLNLRR